MTREQASRNERDGGWIVRLTSNPAMVLCTDGYFHLESFVGPGRDLCARVYRTERNATTIANARRGEIERVGGHAS